METLHRERRFALIMGVTHADGFIDKYNSIINRLAELEAKYKRTHPFFKMDDMWTCNSIKGQIKFEITRSCEDVWLQRKLLVIFNGVLA